MSVCKGVKKDIEKVAGMMNVKVSRMITEAISQRTETLITELHNECRANAGDNRKIITADDLKRAVQKRGLEILYPLFEAQP